MASVYDLIHLQSLLASLLFRDIMQRFESSRDGHPSLKMLSFRFLLDSTAFPYIMRGPMA
jgi:hypothetical protein